MKKSVKIVIALLVSIIIIATTAFGITFYFFMKQKSENSNPSEVKESNIEEKEEIKSDSSNAQINGNSNVSFANMNADDKDLNEKQQEILKYFDDDYFLVYPVSLLQQYPQVFNNSKIEIGIRVVKVLKSSNDEFEVLAILGEAGIDSEYNVNDINSIPESELIVIKGKQMNERFIVNDTAVVYGRYNGVENYEIDGKTYVLPSVTSIHTLKDPKDGIAHRFDLATIKTVAQQIFGNDIKVTEPSSEEYSENIDLYVSNNGAKARDIYTYQDRYYTATLDNQSNANFKAFDIHIDTTAITYNPKVNDMQGNVMKKLYVSADFQHYIVTTHDEKTKHIYIDYFNKDLEKLWSKEFDYESNSITHSPMDYTTDKLSIVIDDELHILDLKNGEDIVEPVIVGERLTALMVEDGTIVIGNDNKNTIMKIGFDGQIKFKQNANTGMSDIKVANVQIIDGKLMLELKGKNRRFLVINADGTIEFTTEDLSN